MFYKWRYQWTAHSLKPINVSYINRNTSKFKKACNLYGAVTYSNKGNGHRTDRKNAKNDDAVMEVVSVW